MVEGKTDISYFTVCWVWSKLYIQYIFTIYSKYRFIYGKGQYIFKYILYIEFSFPSFV